MFYSGALLMVLLFYKLHSTSMHIIILWILQYHYLINLICIKFNKNILNIPLFGFSSFGYKNPGSLKQSYIMYIIDIEKDNIFTVPKIYQSRFLNFINL